MLAKQKSQEDETLEGEDQQSDDQEKKEVCDRIGSLLEEIEDGMSKKILKSLSKITNPGDVKTALLELIFHAQKLVSETSTSVSVTANLPGNMEPELRERIIMISEEENQISRKLDESCLEVVDLIRSEWAILDLGIDADFLQLDLATRFAPMLSEVKRFKDLRAFRKEEVERILVHKAKVAVRLAS